MGCKSSKQPRQQVVSVAKAGQSNQVLYKAIAEFKSGSNDVLQLRAGDIVEILLKKPHAYWWMARNQATGLEGFIPKNFVAKCDSIESELWYFGAISRLASEKSLQNKANRSGAFLVRDSETYKGNYVLSVITRGNINHYRIRCSDSGEFFIGNTKRCKSLQALIKYHSGRNSGITESLVKPCVKTEVPVLYDLSHHDEWEVKRSSVKLKRKLGSGQFGNVYQGIWNRTTPVAVKTLKAGTRMNRDDFLEEAKIMKQLHHPKLVQLYAVVTVGEPIYIITELMRFGALLSYLRNARQKIAVEGLVDMAQQVAAGMAFLEAKFYIHRDLAARNVLVGENCTVKVADFGLARSINEQTATARSRFPIKWTAPEAAMNNQFTTKSDVWSFGILLYEIITRGDIPYADMTNTRVIEEISNGYRLPRPRGCSPEFYEIMTECWHKNPAMRPTFETLQWKLQTFFSTGNERVYSQEHAGGSGPSLPSIESRRAVFGVATKRRSTQINQTEISGTPEERLSIM